MDGSNSFIEKFSMVAAKIGNQIHLRTLRDSFATLVPMYILAGVATLLSSTIFPLFLEGDALATVSMWSTAVGNGTLNFSGVMICGLAGYFLAGNRRFGNKISCLVVSLATLIIMMPMSVTASLADGSGDTADITSALIFDNLGVKGLFAGIIIGLVATEVFIRFSSIEKLKVDLGEGIPPAVANTFNVLIPMMITLSIFGIINTVLVACFSTDLIALIKLFVQTPLSHLGSSLPAVLFIYTCGNLLFFFGIHQSTINGVLLEPILTVACTENMAAYAAGESIPNILTMNDLNFFGQFGGTGCTICLILACWLVSKNKAGRAVSSMSVLPGLFNINEPMIFGYPIVYNLPLLVPFLGVPVISVAIHYFAQVVGLVSPTVAYIPWNTPPLISGFLGTAGDWRTVVLQAALIVLGTLIYIPFVKMSDKAQELQMQQQAELDTAE